ncbi:hypothetical protein HPB50_024194 [Hyalomma asiaticum]|uniref:Uncharacterized protein n=1 Tax=Hyalomma asiaticum TaxID=266040 RepID=A0ACB7RTQ9_HYAAI|nr:hypothetical protein HPB50_024194 [Hyalomma asiaticum]
MSADDLNLLAYYLNKAPTEELHRIDDFRFTPFPKLSGSTRERAIGDVILFLKSVDTLDDRLDYMTWFYCWLVSQNVFGPWMLYRLDESSAEQYAQFPERLERAMSFPAFDAKMGARISEHGCSACIMTKDTAIDRPQHEVICMYIPHAVPYVAVCPLALVSLERLTSAISSVLQSEGAQLAVGNYANLQGAMAAAKEDFALMD